MIMTTIVLISGFCSVLVSNTRDHRVWRARDHHADVAYCVTCSCLPSLLAHFDGRLWRGNRGEALFLMVYG